MLSLTSLSKQVLTSQETMGQLGLHQAFPLYPHSLLLGETKQWPQKLAHFWRLPLCSPNKGTAPIRILEFAGVKGHCGYFEFSI